MSAPIRPGPSRHPPSIRRGNFKLDDAREFGLMVGVIQRSHHRGARAHGAGAAGEMRGAAVPEVAAVDAGDHDVGELELINES